MATLLSVSSLPSHLSKGIFRHSCSSFHFAFTANVNPDLQTAVNDLDSSLGGCQNVLNDAVVLDGKTLFCKAKFLLVWRHFVSKNPLKD